ncbi:MAG: septum formation protein Maf [Thermoleophilia bacterium]|nr:septum formation protein Maf [Thermoleophilia bacterium]
MSTLLLASTSPQRRAILGQLGVPFEVVAPDYEEHDPPGLTPVEAVRAHALGKARSVAAEAAGRIVLGVDTAVVLDGRAHGKPSSAGEAAVMLAVLAGRTHEVVSGLCVAGPGFEDVEHETTRVTFRSLPVSTNAAYVETGEWEGRAGGYAIQGRGAALVTRVEGDYLNVVGLPAALLVTILSRRLPGELWFSSVGQ